MNTNSTKSSTLDYTTTSSNTELSGKDTHQNTTKSGTPRKTSTMPNVQSNDSTNDTHSNPEWVKVKTPEPRRPASTPLEPHQGWEDKRAGFGPFAPTSPGYSGPNEEELEKRQREAKQNMKN